MSRYVAAYDISSDPHRTAVARLLLRYGDRLQKSVFEVWLEPEEVRTLRVELGPLLNDGDLFELIPIDLASTRGRWRWGEPAAEYTPVIVLGFMAELLENLRAGGGIHTGHRSGPVKLFQSPDYWQLGTMLQRITV